MKRLLRRPTTYISVSILAVVLFVFGGFILNQQANASNQSGRLITIHDRGQEKLILSEAKTIAEAIADAGITLDSKDAVEPALTEKLVASEYNVNIYRARPVIVVDGAMRQKVITPYQTSAQIVKDAGINLYPEDQMKLQRSNDIITDGAGLELAIDRATPMTLDLYGSKTEIRTQGETVGDMLREKGITLDTNDRASLDAETPVTPGIEVKVWREGKQTLTVEEAVPFETEKIQDADQEVGYRQIQTVGQTGKRNATYEIDIQNGVEVSRVEIASLVTIQPTRQVEIIGVKQKTLPYTGGGTKTEWLAASSIPQSEWGYADYMVQKESGWNPNAVNKSSGACGLAQALPCSKVPGNPYNPIDSLNWMNSYVNGRYGGWANAYAFWNANRWY